MKVLHVADFLPGLHERVGGAEFAARRIIDEQVAAGVEVAVATLAPANPDAARTWDEHHVLRNIDRLAPRASYVAKQLFYPRDALAARDLAAVVARAQPDLVHFHNLHFSGLSVAEVARAAGIPSVHSIYDYWLFCPAFMLLTSGNELCTRGHGAHCVDCIGVRRAPALRPLKRILFGRRPAVMRPLQAAFDRFVVLSEDSRDVLVRNGIDVQRIAVIRQYLWQEAALTERADKQVHGRLVYVGWVEARKGLHVVLEAMAQLVRDYPSLHLEVLGLPANAEYETQIKRLIADHGLASRVTFHGKIERADLISALQRAFLVTVPEQWENMSPVILTEAMAAGACAVAARVGGIRQFVTDRVSGLLATRDDPLDYARQIRWALDHPDHVATIADVARARARELFDPPRITRETLDLYDEMLRNNIAGH